MMIPDIGDVIEIVIDIPEKNLCAGVQGTVVHCHESDVYEVEFTNDNGVTLDFLALRKKYFVIVWSAKTQQWIPVTEQMRIS